MTPGRHAVAKDFDELFLDFMERRGVQVWPNRNSKGTAIVSWTASCANPFIQTTKQNLKAAIVKLMFKLEELKLK